MTGTPYPLAVRAAAVADYRESGDTIAHVAARHGVARATLGKWVTVSGDDKSLAYVGGWEVRGLVKRPLFPEPRSA